MLARRPSSAGSESSLGLVAGVAAAVAIGATDAEQRAARDPRRLRDPLRRRLRRRRLHAEAGREAGAPSSRRRPSVLGIRADGRDRRQQPARDPARARLARRDHERVQPARQHGWPRRVTRDGPPARPRGRRALDQDSGELALVVALALGGACPRLPPLQLRPGRSARVFMGDSGSQVIGFGLASLALASSWTTAGATLTSLVLPLLVLVVPILDTTLVTVRRTVQRRPVTQGGTDHSSHRLVYYGLSEQQAVAALTLPALLLGATALAYNVLASARVTAVGGADLVRRPRPVRQLPRRPAGALPPRGSRPGSAALASVHLQPRRLVEVLTDFGIICFSFLGVLPPVRRRQRQLHPARHLPRGTTDPARRPLRALRRLRDLPADLALRLGPATCSRSPARSCCRYRSRSESSAQSRPLTDFPLEIFFVDVLLCMTLVAASRLALRSAAPVLAVRAPPQQRVLIVGAGRSGRALARELARDAGDARRRVRRRQPGPEAAPHPRRHRPRRSRRRRRPARRHPGR